MAGKDGEPEFVYRISTAKEWEELQKNGSIFGGDLDKSSGFMHLSKLDQVLHLLLLLLYKLESEHVTCLFCKIY